MTPQSLRREKFFINTFPYMTSRNVWTKRMPVGIGDVLQPGRSPDKKIEMISAKNTETSLRMTVMHVCIPERSVAKRMNSDPEVRGNITPDLQDARQNVSAEWVHKIDAMINGAWIWCVFRHRQTDCECYDARKTTRASRVFWTFCLKSAKSNKNNLFYK